MDTKHIQHLYNRIGFGITPLELQKLKGKTNNEVVKKLFQESETVSPVTIDVSFISNLTKEDLKNKKKPRELMKISRKKVAELNGAWIQRLYNPSEILREK